MTLNVGLMDLDWIEYVQKWSVLGKLQMEVWESLGTVEIKVINRPSTIVKLYITEDSFFNTSVNELAKQLKERIKNIIVIR